MRAGKPDFTLIEAEVLTIGMHRTLGTRGNFNVCCRSQRAVVASAELPVTRASPKTVMPGVIRREI